MEVLDTMCGKWKVDAAATENLDAFAAAMKFPAELTEKMRNEKNMTLEVTRNGDTLNVCTTYSYGPDKLSFKLGETFKSNAMGVEAENLFNVEGNILVGKHTVMGSNTKTRRYLKDGKLVIETEGNGETMKVYMNKC